MERPTKGEKVTKKLTLALLPLLAVAAAFAVVGCGGGDDEGQATEDLTPVTLQSKWVVQAQFAGYYAAVDQGFFEDEGLDVTIRPGGPDIVPEQVVLGGQAEFGINWLDSLLATRDQGQKLVNIAQVFTRSGMTEVTWKDTGLDEITKLEGKKVGVWLGGQRAQAVRGAHEERLGSPGGRGDRRAAVRHEPLPEP